MILFKKFIMGSYHWIGLWGWGFICLLLFFLISPAFTPHDPYQVNMTIKLQPISTVHWLGTDGLGRDVLSRLLIGGQVTLGASLIILILIVGIGLPIGLLSGYIGGRLDRLFMRIADSFLAFPDFLIAIVLTGLLGPHLVNLMISIVAVKWIAYARIVRNTIQVEKNKDYLNIAKLNSVGLMRILYKHLLPHANRQVTALIPLDIGKIILMIASLSYIGLGVQPPGAELGTMLYEGKSYFYHSPRLMLIPGIVIMIIVVLANLTSDHIQSKLGFTREKR